MRYLRCCQEIPNHENRVVLLYYINGITIIFVPSLSNNPKEKPKPNPKKDQNQNPLKTKIQRPNRKTVQSPKEILENRTRVTVSKSNEKIPKSGTLLLNSNLAGGAVNLLKLPNTIFQSFY
jgi:hypothetical protein